MNRRAPKYVDSTKQFAWYKPIEKKDRDVSGDYFLTNHSKKIHFLKKVDFSRDYQFCDYKKLDYNSIHPFIQNYFHPSLEILDIISSIEYKYDLHDYSNICVLFYRGNDKITETKLCSYSEIVEKARFRQAENPNIRFLIQSDETEFIEKMLSEFPNAFYFKDEIRHMKKSDQHQVDLLDLSVNSLNHIYSKYYLAITIIMSKCKYLVFGSGNCSLWIVLYRNNANNVSQYLNGEWL